MMVYVAASMIFRPVFRDKPHNYSETVSY